MARKRAENRERSLGFPGFVKPVFTKDIKPLGKRKRSLGHLGSVKPVLTLRSSSRNEKERIKLPKLIIPKFYGEIRDWLNFWNSFKSAIHENDNVCKIDKLNYLRSFWGGSSFNLIDGLEEHYDHSIDILKQRFGDKKVLINMHIEKLLQTSPLKNSNDVTGFRNLFNHTQKNVRSLESLSVKKHSYSRILVPILTKLLPRDLLLEYNKLQINTSGCEIDMLTDFLSSQLTARERTFLNVNNYVLEMKQSAKMNHSEYRRQNTASALINESRKI
ncbi:uncharacterized protein TNCV_5128311 [Trichonephila clavipes]|nr:uncharacterized protein TNCV_5128311 [Trichonephila clavipes]